MSLQAIETAHSDGAADMLFTLAAAEGSAAHRFVKSQELLNGRNATRNLADAVHYLCVLHGRHPGVIDHAATKSFHPAAAGWLIQSAEAFAAERTFLTRLVVAAGPIPSTPGQAESEAAVIQQQHALDMLAQSDRAGCALGAAFALALDWREIRAVLGEAAMKLGLDVEPLMLPDDEETRTVAAEVAETSAIERAMVFGAQQVLAQHRGLWDLLEARQMARAAL